MRAPPAPDSLMSDESREQLDRIERRLADMESQLRQINGAVRRHEHELYGADQRGGLVDDMRRVWERIETAMRHAHQSEAISGMVPARTMWGAIGAIAAVASVIVALVVGLS